ncbi:hypothetical protein C8J57DRAFT_1540025 [Mycena rebaudengoi]|nr:hypothetical protein C8J57DRAFT_1540025 [Mycena rebaudengoi]
MRFFGPSLPSSHVPPHTRLPNFIEASYRHPRLLLYPFTPYSYPDHPLQTPHHHPLLRTRRSYNDGPGLTPHRLQGDAALKSVVATGLYLLESPRAADLKRARLLMDPWGVPARAAALIGCTSSISRFVGAAQKAWHKTIDVRIKLLLRQRALFTIVNLLNGRLNSIGQQLPSLFASFASLGCIQGFLQIPEKAEAESDGATRDVTDLVGVLAKFVTSLDREVPRTLGKDIYTEVALRRWCSSDEALANNPSPTKTGIIRGVDAVRFTGLRRVVRCVPATESLIKSLILGFPRILVYFIPLLPPSTLLVDTKAPKALDKKPVVFARTATPMPEGRGL